MSVIHSLMKEKKEDEWIKLLTKDNIREHDNEGYTPLHLAAKYVSAKGFTALIDYSPDLEVKGPNDVTALHLAAIHGREDIIPLLLKKGANQKAKTKDNLTAFKLALRNQHHSLAEQYFPLKYYPSLSLLIYYDQLLAEKFRQGEDYLNNKEYEKALLTFETILYEQNILNQQNIAAHILSLQKIAKIFLAKRDHKKAAICYNGAQALYMKNKDSNFFSHTAFRFFEIKRDLKKEYDNLLIEKCARVEQDYIKKLTNKEVSLRSITEQIASSRRKLFEIRDKIEKQLDNNKNGLDLSKQLTEEYKKLFTSLIRDCIDYLGKPPCAWAMGSVGSMSRGEMCLYSDLEYVIIIADSGDEVTNQKNKEYFRKLANLIEIKVINCGETEFPILSPQTKQKSCKFHQNLKSFKHLISREESPTPSGFSIDMAGLNPLGRNNVFELICTADEMVQLNQQETFLDEQEHLANALKTMDFLTGSDPNLINQYDAKLNSYLNQPFSKNYSNRRHQALRLLGPSVEKYQPDLNAHKQQEQFFHVKRELYRLPNMAIESLALYFGISEKTSIGRLNQLHEQKIISEAAKNQLIDALQKIMHFRLRVQAYYKDEIEHIHNPFQLENSGLTETELKNIFKMNEEDIKILFSIYSIILPFFRHIQAFYHSQGEVSILQQAEFNDPILQTQADVASQLGIYQHGLDSYRKALAIDPGNVHIALGLAGLLMSMKKNSEAIPILLSISTRLKQIHKDKLHPDMLITLRALSVAYFGAYKHSDAFDVLKQILEIQYHFSRNEPTEDILNSLMYLGLTRTAMRDLKGGLSYFDQCGEMLSKIYGDKLNSKKALYLLTKGMAYSDHNDWPNAISSLEQALKIRRIICSEKQSEEVADVLIHLISMYRHVKEFSKGIAVGEEALAILYKKYGKHSHPSIVSCIREIAGVYAYTGEVSKAILTIQQAMDIVSSVASEKLIGPNPVLADLLADLGKFYIQQEDFPRAKQCYEQALSIQQQIHGEEVNNYVLSTWKKLAHLYSVLGEHEKAVETEIKVSSMAEIVGEKDPFQKAVRLASIANEYHLLKNYSEAANYNIQALEVWQEISKDKVYYEMVNLLDRNAIIFATIGLNEQARKLWEEIIALYETTNKHLSSYQDMISEDDIQLSMAYIYLQLGGQYHLNGNLQRASDFYKKVLNFTGNNLSEVKVRAQDRLNSIAFESKPFILQAASYFGSALWGYGATAASYFSGFRSNPNKKILNQCNEYKLTAAEHIKNSRFKEAIDDYLKALTILEGLDKDNFRLDIAEILNELGELYFEINDYSGATRNFERSLEIYKKISNDKHLPTIATILFNLGITYSRLQKYAQAKIFHEEAYLLRQRLYGDECHGDTARSLYNLGVVWLELGNNKQAEIYLTKAQAMFERLVCNKRDWYLAKVQSYLATCYCKMGDYFKAKDLCLNAIKIFTAIHHALHPEVLEMRAGIATCDLQISKKYQSENNLEKAREYFVAAAQGVYSVADDYLFTHKDIGQAIYYYERVLSFAKNKHVYHNLACCYHVKAVQERNNDYLQKADDCFNAGIKLARPDDNQSIMAEYAGFLYAQKRYSDAIKWLQQVIDLQNTQPDAFLSYTTSEKCVLPQDLIKELTEENSIKIHSLILAYFYLIYAYINTNQMELAKITLGDMLRIVANSKVAIDHELLGYSYQSLRMYNQAADSFKKAIQLNNNYRTAKENLANCQKMIEQKYAEQDSLLDLHEGPAYHERKSTYNAK